MADQPQPRISPPPSSEFEVSSENPRPSGKAKHPSPGTYVIQIPKDQIYRMPPLANTARGLSKAKGKKPRCRVLCCCFTLIFLILLLLGALVAILFLIIKPEQVKYSLGSISIKGLNLTTSRPSSPEISITILSENHNRKISAHYQAGSVVNLYYDALRFGVGKTPAFSLGRRNVTVINILLKEHGIVLGSQYRTALLRRQKNGYVPLRLTMTIPAKLKVGPLTTWTLSDNVDCDVAVSRLSVKANIVGQHCKSDFDIW